MFENILGQEEAVFRLKSDIVSKTLPPSMLFSGPPASGKLTSALELARILSCLEPEPNRAAWNCPCSSCARHRILAHPDLLLLGPRSFPEEVTAARALLDKSPSRASIFFFVRSLRKLAKRFDAALYEGEESKLAKAASLLRDLEERLDALSPDRALGGKPADAGLAVEALAAAEAAMKLAEKLEPLVPDAPPVFQIRAAELWARRSPWGERKTIIIENADRLMESARNALLKILEEPPASVAFVLTTSRRSAIIRTVLSRVRTYPFAARDAASSALVLERVFRESGSALAAQFSPAGTNSVEAFLSTKRAFPPAAALESAKSFLASALRSRKEAIEKASAAGKGKNAIGDGMAFSPPLARLAGESKSGSAETLAAIFARTKDFGQKDEAFAGSFDAFVSAVADVAGGLLRERDLSASDAMLVDGWARLLREARDRRATFNLSAGVLAEGLLYAMGEI